MNAEPDLTMRQVMRLLDIGRQALRNVDKGRDRRHSAPDQKAQPACVSEFLAGVFLRQQHQRILREV